ncbi:ABC transporter permease [Flavobacterium agricola]|uniref:ABC transporter permease n=1 Tax=Flavobacterium agricola TaxID=2870839 RepID=A0ABY6LYN8_9FLAO|nr:ABC transporter permease [Flavobacterium agricola]UYW01443.1 ABC transporter permease [Flavobacterium agricola]
MIGLVIENTKIALGAIRSQLLRTILTVLIIAIGILALVAILTVVGALKNTMTNNFASMGANTFNISQYDFSDQIKSGQSNKKVNPRISFSEAQQFKENYAYPFATTAVYFNANQTSEIKYNNIKTDPKVSVLGVDAGYVATKGLEVVQGRNFSGIEIDNNLNVCIIGSDLEKALFKEGSGLNKTISVRGNKFKVIGVLKPIGSTFGNNEDNRMLIPIHNARSIFSSPNTNYQIDVLMPDKNLIDEAIDQATLTMRNVRNLTPTNETNFGIERSDSTLRSLTSNLNALEGGAWVISIITIMGSSIALMNIMLVSVTERTREIGIRKSLGANSRTIAMQFFTETLVISFMGGILGICNGVLIGFLVAKGLDFDFNIPWNAISWAVIISGVVAILSGLIPAIKASKLDPVEALRYE